MIPVAMFKKFIASVEVCNMARYSSKSDELRNINSMSRLNCVLAVV